MLRNMQAMRTLEEGCSRLGLPNSTAAALLQFLSVKRIHDQFVPEQDRQLVMSPGDKLDKLWHYMLLNTSVSSCVHALLGGVVDHRGTDAWDLADDTKLLQRLYALNVLRLEGHDPDAELWTEPGTAMHTLCLTAYPPLSGLLSLPGGGRMYVTPTLTPNQRGQVVRALRALYAEDAQRLPSNGAAVLPAASAAAAAAAANGYGSQPAAKRQRVEQQQQQQQQQQQGLGDADKLTLIVKDLMGIESVFKVKPHIHLCQLFEAYADHKLVDLKCCRFLYDGFELSSDATETPQEMGMGNDTVIACIIRQTGC